MASELAIHAWEGPAGLGLGLPPPLPVLQADRPRRRPLTLCGQGLWLALGSEEEAGRGAPARHQPP